MLIMSSMFPTNQLHQPTSPARSRCSSYSGNLSPIDESTPPELESQPLIINNLRVAQQLKRKHLNSDCRHLVSVDFETVVRTVPEDYFFTKSNSPSGDKSFKSWIFQTFWSTSKRKKFSIFGVFAASCVILAASGYYFFQRQPRLQAVTSG